MVSLAWLLENRRNIPTSGKEWFKDSSQWVARIGNHYIVNKLGGWGPTLASEKLSKNDINAIWDDRVLNHAYQVFGGMPKVILEAANNAIPEDLKKRLTETTTRSAGRLRTLE
jgi:hypothetical protein